MIPHTLSVDVMPGVMRTGVVGLEGTLHATTVHRGDAAGFPEALRRAYEGIRRDFGEPPREMAYTFPGIVDPLRGMLHGPDALSAVGGAQLAHALRPQYEGAFIFMERTRMRLAAERRYGHAQGLRWAILLDCAEPRGIAVMLDGRLMNEPGLRFGHPLLPKDTPIADRGGMALALERLIPAYLPERILVGNAGNLDLLGIHRDAMDRLPEDLREGWDLLPSHYDEHGAMLGAAMLLRGEG